MSQELELKVMGPPPVPRLVVEFGLEESGDGRIALICRMPDGETATVLELSSVRGKVRVSNRAVPDRFFHTDHGLPFFNL